MAKDWKVTGQKLETVLNQDNSGFTQQWNIGYLVTEGPAKGTRGEVHASPGDMDGDYVERAIATMVDRHHKTASL